MGYFELDLTISRDVKAITKEVQQLAKKHLRPAGIELDSLHNPADVYAKKSVIRDVFRAYRSLDLHALDIPVQTGGMAGELDHKARPIIVEEMGHGDPGLAISLEVSNLPFVLAAMSPEPEVQNLARAYCEDKGANMIGCWAVPDSGDYLDWLLSDNGAGGHADNPSDMEALSNGDGYLINGETTAWVSNAPIATHAAVLVGLDSARGIKGSGLAVVPLDLPGITRSSPLDRIGQRPLPKSRIVFADVKIPATFMVIDDLEKARPQLKTMLARTNAINAAASVGLAQAAYEEALNYAKQRLQGGVPIFEHKNIRLQLFNMFLKVETARAYNRRVGEYNLTAPSVSGHHSLAAKVLSTRTAFEVASDAIAIFGGNGLTKEYPVEKMFRDARVAMISDGENNALSIAGAGELAK
jgi:alkylation response protein AidB-like acyl-CoA dehydrogenase